jgi:hypothetical protein
MSWAGTSQTAPSPIFQNSTGLDRMGGSWATQTWATRTRMRGRWTDRSLPDLLPLARDRNQAGARCGWEQGDPKL